MAVTAQEVQPIDDRELLDRHLHGDPEAFEVLYGRYQSMIYNLALRMSGRPEDAADLAQESLIRVYRNLDRFRGRSSLKTWIFRVTLNCCRSRLRRRGRRRSRTAPVEPEAIERLPDPAAGPEERASTRDLRAQLERALAELPLPFREAVVLRDVQGLSYVEIAEIAGIRIGTVRSRLARGRERLRRRLEREEAAP